MTPASPDPAEHPTLRPVEWLLLGYLLATTVCAALRLTRQPAAAWVIAANALSTGLVVLVARPGLGPFARGVREICPLLLLPALYPALDILNNFGGVSVHDALVRRWEQALFGAELSRTWWQAHPSRFWSTVLHGAYFAYYAVLAGPLIYFLARRRIHAARRLVNWLIPTFLACYAIFLGFPVAGPYYEFPRPDGAFLANPMARLVYATLERGSAYGAAFPSSHVAATLVATAAAFAGSRPLGLCLTIPAALLTVGVVYCQMHYAVDALAGVALAAVVVGVGLRLERSGVSGSRDAGTGGRPRSGAHLSPASHSAEIAT
ncbi:MAG TPA: phosphatase PAP2 family protein [Gemmatimonadales bacterium]|nr:phosphatase PAP2 family protein [Gemmatimonadales bacterium]